MPLNWTAAFFHAGISPAFTCAGTTLSGLGLGLTKLSKLDNLRISPPCFASAGPSTPKAADIWRYAIPKTPVVLEQYLQFLLADNKLDAAEPVAAQLVEVAERPQVNSLLVYSDATIAAKRPPQRSPAGTG